MTTTGHADQAPPRILIVDDDREIRLMYREGLQFVGYEVVEAGNGGAALAVVEEQPVDLVVSDVSMPGVSGTELLAVLRDRYPQLPVILVTGYPAIEAAVECIRLGAVDYLSKPLQLDRLLSLVKHTLGRRQPPEHRTAPVLPPTDRPIPAHFDYVRTLGSGAVGTVYLVRAIHPPNDLRALKALRLDQLDAAAADKARLRFAHEIVAAMRVDHPNVVRIHEHGLAGRENVPYVVMEYVAGRPLSFLIRHDVLTYDQRLAILRDSAAGLDAIHRAGICHRDVKPDNLLVDHDLHPKLVDFGIARLPESELTLSQTIIGSPAYMAPEAFRSARVSPAADIFSWAVVAYELFHGHRLFEGETLSDLMRDITSVDLVDPRRFDVALPRELRNLLMSCLHKRPEQRPQSMRQIIAQLP